jgi:hypothetical protein
MKTTFKQSTITSDQTLRQLNGERKRQNCYISRKCLKYFLFLYLPVFFLSRFQIGRCHYRTQFFNLGPSLDHSVIKLFHLVHSFSLLHFSLQQLICYSLPLYVAHESAWECNFTRKGGGGITGLFRRLKSWNAIYTARLYQRYSVHWFGCCRLSFYFAWLREFANVASKLIWNGRAPFSKLLRWEEARFDHQLATYVALVQGNPVAVNIGVDYGRSVY